MYYFAAMAELVDALDSGSSQGNLVDVRLILAAHFVRKAKLGNSFFPFLAFSLSLMGVFLLPHLNTIFLDFLSLQTNFLPIVLALLFFLSEQKSST